MDIDIDFSLKYANLINKDLPRIQLKSEDDSDIPMISSNIPDKYRRQFIHPEDGFVKKYCEDYDKSKEPIKRKKYGDDAPKGLIKRKKYY